MNFYTEPVFQLCCFIVIWINIKTAIAQENIANATLVRAYCQRSFAF